MEFRKMLSQQLVLLDGAMGTMLQAKGLEAGERPELLSITRPEWIREIHQEYIAAGAQMVYANTFGANAHKLEGTGYSTEQVVAASVQAAKEACSGTNCKVALDIGPIGEMLEPSGSLTFEEAYQLFCTQAVQGEASGADCVVIETMTDLQEVRAALLAVKENTSLPVMVTMTFEENHRTFTGCSISAMALTLEGLGADALGINCSLGPAQILPLAQELAAWTNLPIVVKANAGLPNLESGAYDVTPALFAAQMEPFLSLGVSLIGGCCGTTPAYIAALYKLLAGKSRMERSPVRRSALCCATKTVELNGVRIIGERINPTGKKLMKQALLEGNMDYVLAQGVSQVEAGAHILDVNVGLPDVDEPALLVQVIKGLQGVVDAPLQIDSANVQAVEAALRITCGKAIVNSVNGEQKILDAVLPLVKKYGAAVVGLTLDENGIPPLAHQRLAIARHIVQEAQRHGIPKEDIAIDCLTLTASVEQEAIVQTLEAVALVKKELGVHTVLGVSNVSFGLPNRELLNHSFLMLALAHGLDLPILNPNINSMTDAVKSFNLLYNRDKNAKEYIKSYANTPQKSVLAVKEEDLSSAIAKGLREQAKAATLTLLQTHAPLEVVNLFLVPALDTLGIAFERGDVFLPQLLQGAQAAQGAFDVVKETLAKDGAPTIFKGKILLATVKGDIHDIGKNIAKVILENYGFQIIDLGKDVPVEKIVRTVEEQHIPLVGLSALMTTTLGSMEQTISALHARTPFCKIFVGGAVLTPEYAQKIGADFYAKDAKASADYAGDVLATAVSETQHP